MTQAGDGVRAGSIINNNRWVGAATRPAARSGNGARSMPRLLAIRDSVFEPSLYGLGRKYTLGLEVEACFGRFSVRLYNLYYKTLKPVRDKSIRLQDNSVLKFLTNVINGKVSLLVSFHALTIQAIIVSFAVCTMHTQFQGYRKEHKCTIHPEKVLFSK